MSDEHQPDEHPSDEHASDEPTQPLAGWRASAPEPAPDDEQLPEPLSETGSDAPAIQPQGRPYGSPDVPEAAPPESDPEIVESGPEPRRDTEDGFLAGPPPYAARFGDTSGAEGADSPTQALPQDPPPTIPLGPPPGLQGPGGPYGQQTQQGQQAPGWFGPGPYPQRPMYALPAPTRRPPMWVWPAVAAVALVVGVLGGLAGGALQDELASHRGTNSNGLGGVRTQTAAPLEADNGSVAAVAQALLPSTVQIVAEFGGQARGATGSGFVLDRDGHVVTNNHVVASAADDDGPIVVIDQAGKRHDATVVGRSAVYDLAVLDVESAADLEPAALGASQVLRVGDAVVAFGAPLGLSQTVTSGIVSALNRPVTTSGESDDESSYINAVQTDAAINPGNSGGPLVNLAGEVVGVNSAIATTGGATGESGNIGVGFAIPIEQVRTTVDQILRTGKAEYPVIGASVRTGGETDVQGATITEVMADTPAERAGLQQDDVITAVDDQPVSDGIALIVAIRTHLPGDTVEMTVRRGSDESVVEVVLDGNVG
ncbi:S1C family serine protease [Nocardioides hwasunensis]|uniref:Trypsin-like peptidase domain-containing protein n=1 Tax=Nocardioides hwasunensis TaxID=397258 RepID=A0ABR8MJR0_9ACTN|nr:trypsin-like peptidase domain-containing protein [Nocardioides hwasunensis]MBD3914992.1 trypsin-like peptidase domain-containing protein [Nocardioides hwasunensis]